MPLALPRRVLWCGPTANIYVDSALLLTFGPIQTAVLHVAVHACKPTAETLEMLPAQFAEREYLVPRINRRFDIIRVRQFEDPRWVLFRIRCLGVGHC